jgi:apolipoprotein N-acyltransferase
MPVSAGGWALFTLALSLQGIVFALFFPAASLPVALRLFLIPSVWVFAEWVRSIFLGGFVWSIGYAHASFPELIQAASWGGVYSLAWLIIAVNAALFLGIRSAVDGRMRRRFFMLAAMIVALGLIIGALRIAAVSVPSGNVRVAAIQANIARADKIRDELYDVNVARHMSLTKKAVMAGGLGPDDLVIWPETAFTDDILTDIRWRPRLEEAARNLRVNMLVGSALLWDGHDLNSAALLSSQGAWQGVYHKMHLVPFSEWTPSGFDALARAFGVGKYHFKAGTRGGIMPFGAHRAGVVICSEEFYPDMFRHAAQARVDVVASMLNDGWFDRREALLMHALTAPVRAVESGVAVIRAANTGKTCAFDAYGRPFGKVLELQRPGIGVYQVPLMPVRTFYAEWGDLFALACGVFVIINFMMGIVRGSKHAA